VVKKTVNKTQPKSTWQKIGSSKIVVKIKKYNEKLNYLGLVFALLFYVLSILPSLLPRTSVIQGLVTGISIVSGYGVGVLISFLIRWFSEKDAPSNVKKHAWKALAILAPIVIIFFGALGSIWHDEVRELVGLQPDHDLRLPVVLGVSILIAIVILAISRAIRRFFRFLFRKIDILLPRRISYAISLGLVAFLVIWTASGLLAQTFIAVANSIYSQRDTTTPEGYVQPTNTLRSGSPESLSTWDTLGFQGRKFVAGGPSSDELTAYNKTQAEEPIRVYVGLKAAESAEDRAEIAVAELKRTGAFEKDILILATTTGSGWLEPPTVDSLEYIYNGNSAIVSQQYSYLPSWISYLVDAETATQAGQALYDAVFSAWSELPKNERPKLIAYGLSLGSFGGQTPYSGINDLRLSIDGALFQGTPNFTTLWRNTTDNRDEGSPEWQPTYKDGVTARFASTNEDITKDTAKWTYPRVLYMQHASDPVVWFDFSLITQKPDWLNETRGPDVSPATRWYPIVSFVQLGIDQMMAASVPVGHGHQYANTVVDSWVAVTNPPNWTEEKSVTLQEFINTEY
jgi:uncharacterized membrane protein